MEAVLEAPSVSFTCPECGLGFSYARILGLHRKRKHGVAGKHSRLKQKSKQLQTRKPAVELPELEDEGAITDSLVGYAMGKLEAQAEQIAKDNGVPSREFVRRVAQYLAVIVKHA